MCDGSNRRELPCGSIVVFHTFKAGLIATQIVSPLPLIRDRRAIWRSKKVVVKKKFKWKRGCVDELREQGCRPRLGGWCK